MCEMLAVQSALPVPVEQVLTYAELLDEYGIAGFSWGIVWTAEDGTLQRYRSTDGIHRDTMYARTLKNVFSESVK